MKEGERFVYPKGPPPTQIICILEVMFWESMTKRNNEKRAFCVFFSFHIDMKGSSLVVLLKQKVFCGLRYSKSSAMTIEVACFIAFIISLLCSLQHPALLLDFFMDLQHSVLLDVGWQEVGSDKYSKIVSYLGDFLSLTRLRPPKKTCKVSRLSAKRESSISASVPPLLFFACCSVQETVKSYTTR